MSNKSYLEIDVCILGAGASGLFCASLLGEKLSTLILEKNKTPGQKILISGGGKCNFTNLRVTKEDFLSRNKNFHISALKNYPSSEFIDLVEKYQINYFEKELGQLFCAKTAKSITGMLLQECENSGAKILCQQTIDSVEKKAEYFFIETQGYVIKSKYCIVATGGLSFPKLGASSFGFDLAKKFGHSIVPTSAALVGLQYPGFVSLAGVSSEAEVKIQKKKIRGPVLFSHKGFTGPAILKASLYWEAGLAVSINWLPDINLREEFERLPSQTQPALYLKKLLPARMVDFFLDNYKIDPKKTLNEISKKSLNKLIDGLQHFQFIPTSSAGYDRAEVTKGGVNTKEIDSKSMESKLVPRLYFIGEVLDVTGQLGGFNFQWAWASANAAATHLKSDSH